MIDHNERAAEARALRQAAADARAMHDPVNPDCEAWAEWLDARAERVISGVTHVTDRSEPPVQPPTREQIDTAVGAVLFNASNYPPAVVAHILGQDIGPLRAKVTDAVLALFPQPIPSPARPVQMTQGVTFTAHPRARRFIYRGGGTYRDESTGAHVSASAFDPSTIREVTPPATTPEEG